MITSTRVTAAKIDPSLDAFYVYNYFTPFYIYPIKNRLESEF